jgi:putative transposase
MHNRPPRRLPGFSSMGKYRYSLRFCTEERSPVFVCDEPVTLVLSQFLRAALETSVVLVAYCFMPDHVHLLVEGAAESADGKRFIALAKQYSGFSYAQRYGRRLWQRYAFERVLREDEDTSLVARYILGNPVRAGLARSVEEYTYLGSTRFTVGELMRSVERLAAG